MAGGGGAPQQGDDNALNILWGIVGLFLLGAAIWLAFSDQLKIFLLKLRVLELTVINFVIQLLPLKLINLDYLQQEVARALALAMATDYQNLTMDVAEYLSVVSGSYLRYPIIICLVIFSYFSFFKNVAHKYKKRYDMHRLAEQERVEWPQINPIIGLDLVNEPLNSGVWAMANSPLDFAKKHQLLEITVEKASEFKHGNPVSFKMHLDHDKSEIIFTKQLGKLWRGPEYLLIHQRAILAILVARGCRDSKVAMDLLRHINKSIDHKRPEVIDFSTVDAIWPKYYNQRVIQDIVHAHAYEFTIFIDLLLLARQDGVLATADFLWLKPIDRLFWYVLNSTGRQTYFVEAAGVHAHFLVEKSLGRGLSVPYIKEAVKALKLALDDIIYVPTEEEKQELLKKS
jgi:intracellular multiplication protein IcmP